MNSRVLLLSVLLIGCAPSPLDSNVNPETDLPTWSFQGVHWQQHEGELTYQFNADTLEHFPLRTEARNLSFSYASPDLNLNGEAVHAQFSPQGETVYLHELIVSSKRLGEVKSTSGVLHVRKRVIDLETVVGQLQRPKLLLITPSATLSLRESSELFLTTGSVDGTITTHAQEP